MSMTMVIGVALAKILLRTGGHGDLATMLGDGKDAAAGLFKMLQRPTAPENVGRLIASQLDAYLTIEFRRADESDRVAAVTASCEVFELALRDEQRLIDAVVEPSTLRKYLEDNGARSRRMSLGGDSAAIFDLLLDFGVDWIARHAALSDVFSRAASVHLIRAVNRNLADTAGLSGEVAELQQYVREIGARIQLSPLADEEIALYASNVAALAPPSLLGRARELLALEQFASSGPGQWWGIEGPAQSGKTALTATFCLQPPPGVVIVPFFVRNNQATANDRASFLARVLPRLASLSGLDSARIDDNPARAEDNFRKLLASAGKRCASKGDVLLLLIDALDEDSYNIDRSRIRPSIAGILPSHLPQGVRVVVSTRPNPPLPRDLSGGSSGGLPHPLHEAGVWHALESSPHARAAFSLDDVHELMLSGPGRDIASFLAASGGQLTMSELAELADTNLSQISQAITTSPGRLLLPSRSVNTESYTLGHALISQMIISILEPRLIDMETPSQDDGVAWNDLGIATLEPWRARIRSWAHGYAERGWPVETPPYLLSDAYPALLADRSELHEELVGVLVDESRVDRLYYRHDNTHYTAISQIQRAASAIIDQAESEDSAADLYLLGKLIAIQNGLTTHNGKVPVNLPAVFGALGRQKHALDIALSIPKASNRLEALAALSATLAEVDQGAEALEVFDQAKAVLRYVKDGEERSRGIRQLALSAATLERTSEAISLARSAHSLVDRALALAEIARGLSTAGKQVEAQEIAKEAQTVAIRVPVRFSALCSATAALALAESGMVADAELAIAHARERAAAASPAALRVRAVGTIAIALAHLGEEREAEQLLEEALGIAADMGNWNTRGRSLAVIAQAFASIGRSTQASGIAAGISDGRGRARAWSMVAQVYADNGDLDSARKSAQAAREDAVSIENPGVRSRMLAVAAAALNSCGYPDQAYSAALEAGVAAVASAKAAARSSAQATAALAIDVAGHQKNPSEARIMAATIDDDEDRLQTLLHVGRVCAKVGYFAEAQQTATDAEVLARRLPTERGREHALVAVAETFALAGALGDARKSIDDIVDAGTKSRGGVLIATVLSASDRGQEARTVLSEARSCAASIVQLNAAAHANASISIVLATIGLEQESRAVAAEALTAARHIPQGIGRAAALAQVTQALMAANLLDEAKQVANETFDVTTEVATQVGRASALVHATLALAAVGQNEKSRAALEMARMLAEKSKKSNRQQSVLQQIAQASTVIGDISEANEVASTIIDYQGRAKTFSKMAEVLAGKGHTNAASNALARSWLAAGTLLDSWPLLIDLDFDVAHRLVSAGFVRG